MVVSMGLLTPTAIEAHMVGPKGTVEPMKAISLSQKLNLSINNYQMPVPVKVKVALSPALLHIIYVVR
jgi:hypothetical protein